MNSQEPTVPGIHNCCNGLLCYWTPVIAFTTVILKSIASVIFAFESYCNILWLQLINYDFPQILPPSNNYIQSCKVWQPQMFVLSKGLLYSVYIFTCIISRKRQILILDFSLCKSFILVLTPSWNYPTDQSLTTVSSLFCVQLKKCPFLTVAPLIQPVNELCKLD